MDDSKFVAVSNPSMSEGRKVQMIVGRLDLIALLLTVLGLAAVAVMVVVLAVIEFGRLVLSIWGNHYERWLLVFLGMAILWVGLRWKRLNIF